MKREQSLFLLLLVAASAMTACELLLSSIDGVAEGEGEGEGEEGEGEEGEGEGEGEEGEGEEGEGEGEIVDGWTTLTASPCGFNRMDALHVDDDNTLWTGCGSNTEGTGLFASEDGGASWALVRPNGGARNFFETFRVLTISRSTDGLLYVGGTGGGKMVVSLNDALDLATVYEAPEPAQVGESFTVGGFRRDPAGRSIIESFTGTDALARTSDDDPFEPLNLFTDGENHQVLDLLVQDGNFYASGSTIAEPPLLFLPNITIPQQPIAFDVIDLSADFPYDGEMFAIASTSDTLLIGGVDEESDDGRFYVYDLFAREIEAEFFVSEFLPNLSFSVVRGACATGEGSGRYVVVGDEPSATGEGFVLASDDKLTWEVITPPDVGGSISKCQFLGERLFVAGAGGYVAVHDFD